MNALGEITTHNICFLKMNIHPTFNVNKLVA